MKTGFEIFLSIFMMLFSQRSSHVKYLSHYTHIQKYLRPE